MRLILIAVGRLRSGPAQALYAEYNGRLRPPLELIEVEERRPLPGPELMRREGELLLARDAEHVGEMPELVRLRLQGGDHLGMAVAQRIDGDAGDEVEVASPVLGVEAHALAPLDLERRGGVHFHHMAGHGLLLKRQSFLCK